MTTGARLRASGQSDVLAADVAPHRNFAAVVREAVEVVGRLRPEFTADMLDDWIAAMYPDARPHHPNVMPAVLGGLAAAGRIEAVGWHRSPRSSRRHGWGRIWQVTPRSAGGVTPAP